MKTIITLFFMPIILSCGENQSNNEFLYKENNNFKPFEITITNISLAKNNYKYILTEKQIKVVSGEEVQPNNDSVMFSCNISPNKTLQNLSDLNLDSINEYYENSCIEDGIILKVRIIKDNKTKDILIHNFHLNDIGQAIELINKFVPEKYKIQYNKDKLIKDKIICDEQNKISDEQNKK